MKILMIGGTKFLGRHLVSAATARGHDVTLFNRGRILQGPLPKTELIRGDRHGDLDRLAGRNWDAVIDTCGYLPQSVASAANALAGTVGKYVFISSISAYADFSQPFYDENTPTAKLSEEQKAVAAAVDLKGDISAVAFGEMYGGLKALCEQEAEKAMPGRTLVIRPGLIVGPYDPTDRFTYWVMRVAKGGRVLAPGDPRRFVQFIDARDLSDWIIEAIAEDLTGAVNAVGEPRKLTMDDTLAAIKTETRSEAEFEWVDEHFLSSENVRAWSEMPLYLPESDESTKGFLSANVDRAKKTGLRFRPLGQTIRDTFQWRAGEEFAMRAGIAPEREADLLAKWDDAGRDSTFISA